MKKTITYYYFLILNTSKHTRGYSVCLFFPESVEVHGSPNSVTFMSDWRHTDGPIVDLLREKKEREREREREMERERERPVFTTMIMHQRPVL